MSPVYAPQSTHMVIPPIPVAKSYAQLRFESFHKKNPEVYRKIVELARLAKRMGQGRYSINGLFENIRWHYLTEKSDKPFKLNNTYRAYYARMIMNRERDLRGFFETRAGTQSI